MNNLTRPGQLDALNQDFVLTRIENLYMDGSRQALPTATVYHQVGSTTTHGAAIIKARQYTPTSTM